MGSFLGHLLPGIFFMIFGVWYSFKIPYRYFTKHRKGRKSRCNIDIVEAIVKIGFPSLGILLEQVTNNGPEFHLTNPSGDYWSGNNWSHCTMYLFFVYAGVADILILKLPKLIPKGIDHFAMGLALLIEGYLFYFHTHGRKDLDVRIHVLLLLAIWTGGAAAFMLGVLDALFHSVDKKGQHFSHNENEINEYIQLTNTDVDTETTPLDEMNESSKIIQNTQDNKQFLPSLKNITQETSYETSALQACHKDHLQVLLQMLLTISILIQGTWFCQIAVILYPPGRTGWDTDLHLNVQFATIFFSWHLALILMYVSVVYMLVCRFTFKSSERTMKL